MRFFKFSCPAYPTDSEFRAKNPVVSTGKYWIPGITCDVCGPWSSSSRLRVPLPSQPSEFEVVQFLPVDEWESGRDQWAGQLGVEPSAVEPGATLGPPTGRCTGDVVEDVVHPMPGEVWVTGRVHEALTAADLTGVSFVPVQLSSGGAVQQLWEVVVGGAGWRQGSTEASLRLCDVCGRRGFPSPTNLAVDEARWDGSDFLLLDGNPNVLVVSSRVADVIVAREFSNVELKPTE